MCKQEALNKRLLVWLSLLAVCCIVCVSFYSGEIAQDNFNYGLEQIHAYDNAMFADNISVVSSAVSPRRFANRCTAWLMSIFDGDWFDAIVLIIRSNYLLYAAAIAFLVYEIVPKHRLTLAVIISGCIMAGSLPSLSFEINGADDAFLGTGIPLAIVGIVFALKKQKNWDAAWLFSVLAAFMHVHEGIWGGFMVGVIWLATSLADRTIRWKELRMVPVYIAVLLMISIPSIAQDESVNEVAFQQIYVFWRTPHHFLLSAWGVEKVVQASFFSLIPFILGIVQMFPYRKQPEMRRKIFLFSSMVILWWGILGVEFFCTEVVASSLLITLYIPKCIKFIVFISYIAYIELGFEAYTRQRYLQAFFAMASLMVSRDWAVVVLVLYLVCWLGKIDERFVAPHSSYIKVILEYGLVAILLVLTVNFLKLPVLVAVLCGILWMVELLDRYSAARARQVFRIAAAVGIAGILCFSLKDKVFRFSGNGVEVISGEECMRDTVGDDLYNLAMDFQRQTASTVTFLADPSSGLANAVQIIARRNCYCLVKNTPSAKGAVLEWYDRIMRTENLSEYTDEKLADLMEELGLEYVLVSGDQLAAVQQSDLFAAVTQTETAGIYRAVQP